MTPEMAFECLLVSHDPVVVCTMNPILRDFSIHTTVGVDPSRAANRPGGRRASGEGHRQGRLHEQLTSHAR
jgi:hypothetical protein